MKYFSKLFVTFTFSEKEREESRADYIARVITAIKERALKCHSDIVEISGELFSNDIKCFQKELKMEPISKDKAKDHKYFVTFVISANKLTANSSTELPADSSAE